MDGVVQGVGYRFFTQRRGEALGLEGWVRNLPDGAVELHAQGPRKALEQLVRELRAGPRFARVRQLESRDVPLDPCLEGFGVRY